MERPREPGVDWANLEDWPNLKKRNLFLGDFLTASHCANDQQRFRASNDQVGKGSVRRFVG
jgi:hypothetical protein